MTHCGKNVTPSESEQIGMEDEIKEVKELVTASKAEAAKNVSSLILLNADQGEESTETNHA